MLGIGKKQAGIEVSAYGKHPAFDDYFTLNISPPLAKALSTWIETGMKSMGTVGKTKKIHAYRFWIFGMKKKELVLGIVRDSSDRFGRAYPLLLLGSTRVAHRERDWPAIFHGFDPVFTAFEEMTTARFESFKAFEARLSTVRISEPEFDTKDAFSKCLGAWIKNEGGRESATIPVSELTNRYISHALPKKGIFKTNAQPPGAVFLGGRPGSPKVHAYHRPLGARDFHRLFNLSGLDSSSGRHKDMDFHTQ